MAIAAVVIHVNVAIACVVANLVEVAVAMAAVVMHVNVAIV